MTKRTTHNHWLTFLLACLLATNVWAQLLNTESFYKPEMKWRPVPLWFWNDTQVQRTSVEEQLTSLLTKDLYGGCAILPFGGNFRPEYLSEEYFQLHGSSLIRLMQETSHAAPDGVPTVNAQGFTPSGIFTISGIRTPSISRQGLYIVNGKKTIM